MQLLWTEFQNCVFNCFIKYSSLLSLLYNRLAFKESRLLVRRKLACHINFTFKNTPEATQNKHWIPVRPAEAFSITFLPLKSFVTSFHVTTLLNSKIRRKVHPSHFILVSNGNYLTPLCIFLFLFLKERFTTHEPTRPQSEVTCDVINN